MQSTIPIIPVAALTLAAILVVAVLWRAVLRGRGPHKPDR